MFLGFAMEILIWETRCLRLYYLVGNNVEPFINQPLSYSVALTALVCFYGSIKRQKAAHLCCHDCTEHLPVKMLRL
jgi:hypothetical protein